VTDVSAITVWLGVIAVASVLQVVLMLGGVVAGAIAYRRTVQRMDSLQRDVVDPVLQRVNTVLDDFHDVAGRVQAADEQLRDAVTRTTRGVGQATAVIGSRFWPVVGVARAIWAALNTIRDRHPRGRATPRGPRMIRPV
jgi:hypothetical protein